MEFEETDHTSTATLVSLNSNVSHQDKFDSKLSPYGDFVFGLFLLLSGIISAIGNGGILGVFYFRRGRLSPAEVFLVNLGVVDILLSLASYPCAIISSFHHRWVFQQTGCTMYAFTCYFFGVASIVSLTAVAIVRYLKTCSPALGNRISVGTSFKIVAWVYVYSFFWAVLPLTGFGGYDVEPFGLSCTLEWDGRGVLSRVHVVLVSIFVVLLPVFIIVFCYTKIVLLVRKSDRLVRDQRLRKTNPVVSDSQLTVISVIITLGFLIGWMPYTVVSFWGTFGGGPILPMWATPIPVLMAKSSISYNPFIYIFLTKRYRDDLANFLRNICFWRKRSEQFHAATTTAVGIGSSPPRRGLPSNIVTNTTTTTRTTSSASVLLSGEGSVAASKGVSSAVENKLEPINELKGIED